MMASDKQLNLLKFHEFCVFMLKTDYRPTKNKKNKKNLHMQQMASSFVASGGGGQSGNIGCST